MLPKRPKGQAPVLSFAQERVWFLQQFEPNNPAYNRPLVMRLQGPLIIDALEMALIQIQERHETLRSIFDVEAGKPTLRISDSPLVELNQHDLSHLASQDRQAAVIREIQSQAQQVFDLQGEPILRANLLRLDEEDHVLSMVFHHLVFDRWSEEVFRSELGRFYRAQLQKQPKPLAELGTTYADFAHWQRTWIESETAKKQGQYWMERLAGDLPILELPVDSRRTLQRSYAAATVFFHLSPDLSRLLNVLSRRSGVTMHSTLLAAFLVLLHRYSSQDDILLGIPAAGRMLPETEPMIGLFVNTLAARYDLSGEPSVQELLQRVSRTTLEDLSNQDYPFELIVQALNPSRDVRTTPLFQVMFNYENVPQHASSFEHLRLESIDYDPGLAQFDLTLEIDGHGDQLACALSFNEDIFDRSTIERMAGHYRTLLEGFLADPSSRISDLPLMTQGELAQLSTGWHQSDNQESMVDNLHTWFQSQVERMPDGVAVEFQGDSLTYTALNAQANRLAHGLIELGVGLDQRVGLCLEPGLHTVVGILGILKAGGAYVPLDPDFPRERLQFILQDAEIELVVTEERFLPKVDRQGLQALVLDSENDRLAAVSSENPGLDVGLRNLAYVLYTSGSTGEPKGVRVSHGNLIHLFRATEARCNFGRRDVWALFHSFTFDFSVWELFGSLLYGGRLIVIPIPMRHALDSFFEQVVFKQLTIMSMIPPLFFEAARMPGFYDRLKSSNLRQIFLGGDLLDEAALQPFFEGSDARHIRVTNIYGPTEATVFITWHPLSEETGGGTLGSLIGKPLDGNRIFIFDAHQNPLPAGVPGEIVVAGASVACGYLNRPGLNQERFIEHPLDPRPGARLYRTGDIGRLRADGVLEFLGRQDSQVKVRGFRIELQEIEAVLQTHPAVAEAVVNVVDVGTGDGDLVAYVILEDDQHLQLTELRGFLGAFLPDYMIPTAMKEIESLPLTPVGKLNRSALPDIGPRERSLPTALVEPKTELEKRLQSIWEHVLQVPQVGVHDNFFNLGGHSLLAMQLVARVRDILSVELNVQDIFGQGRTIGGMAELIELRSWLTSESGDKDDAADQEQGRI